MTAWPTRRSVIYMDGSFRGRGDATSGRFSDPGRCVRLDEWNGFLQVGQFNDLPDRRAGKRHLREVDDDMSSVLRIDVLDGLLEGLALGIGKVALQFQGDGLIATLLSDFHDGSFILPN